MVRGATLEHSGTPKMHEGTDCATKVGGRKPGISSTPSFEIRRKGKLEEISELGNKVHFQRTCS